MHDIFAASDEKFEAIFPQGQDIAFICEVERIGSMEFSKPFRAGRKIKHRCKALMERCFISWR